MTLKRRVDVAEGSGGDAASASESPDQPKKMPKRMAKYGAAPQPPEPKAKAEVIPPWRRKPVVYGFGAAVEARGAAIEHGAVAMRIGGQGSEGS